MLRVSPFSHSLAIALLLLPIRIFTSNAIGNCGKFSMTAPLKVRKDCQLHLKCILNMIRLYFNLLFNISNQPILRYMNYRIKPAKEKICIPQHPQIIGYQLQNGTAEITNSTYPNQIIYRMRIYCNQFSLRCDNWILIHSIWCCHSFLVNQYRTVFCW